MKISIHTKYKIIIVLTCVVFITATIAFGIILPAAKDIITINEKIRNEKESLEIKFQKGQYLRKVIQDLREIEPQLEKLRSVYVLQGDELTFVTDIEKISAAHGLDSDINMVKQDDDNVAAPIKALTLNIHLEGGFSQTFKMLADLEALKYYFNVSNMKFSAGDAKTQKIKSDIVGKIYIKQKP